MDESFFHEESRSHHGTVRTYIHYYGDEIIKKVTTAFERAKTDIEKQLAVLHDELQSMLISFGMQILMERDEVEEDGSMVVREETFYFHSSNIEVFAEGEFSNVVMSAASEITENLTEFVRNGSGWKVKQLESLQVRAAELRLFQKARAKGYLPMPFHRKTGYINFKNKDTNCFKYVVCAGVYMNEVIYENSKKPKFHKSKISNHYTWKKFFNKFDWTPVRNGVDIYGNLSEFEELNSLRIHVFSHKDEEVILIRKSRAEHVKVINIFLIHGAEDEDGSRETRFVLITNLQRFIRLHPRLKRFFCVYCLRAFASSKSLSDHEGNCKDNPVKMYKFPKEGQVLKFHRHDMTILQPFTLIFDWENFSVGCNKKFGQNTIMHTEYLPATFALAVVYNSGDHVSLEACEFHEGPDIVEKFFERIFFHAKRLLTYIRATNNSVVPSREELEAYRKADRCMFCKEKFTEGYGITHSTGVDLNVVDDDDDELLDEQELDRLYAEVDNFKPTDNPAEVVNVKRIRKVYNHNHMTGKMIGATCGRCNTAQRSYHTIPAIAFNSSRWDLHIIVKGLESSQFKAENVRVVARSSEEFVELVLESEDSLPACGTSRIINQQKAGCGNRKTKIRFIDCANFLKGSLAQLADNMRKEKVPAFHLVNQSFPHIFGSSGILEKYHPMTETADRRKIYPTDANISLLLSKLPFAYKYLDGPDKLDPKVPMPERQYYDNDLKKQKYSDEEWERVQQVCEKFAINSFVEWVAIYNVLDVILLAIVWETFRTKTFERFQLDPSSVCTISGLSWHCFLKSSQVELEYIRDHGMVEMLENLRGGISGCSTKIVDANHPNCPGYDPGKPVRYICTVDINSLYPYSMCQPLPFSGWAWADPESLANIDWTDDRIGEKLGLGYILKVDLEYPIEAQLTSLDLPFAPEKRIVKYEMISARQRRILNCLGNRGKSFTTQPKLTLNHFDKINYVIHYKELGFYLKKGLKLRKIHKAIQFQERPFMKEFVTFNLEQRKLSTTESDRSFYKLFSNSLYGRSLLSAKNKIEVKFCTSRTQALKLLADPRLKTFKSLSPNLSLMTFRPRTQTFQNPIGVGFSILGISKRVFYSAVYDQLFKIFGPNLRVGSFDTDGMCFYYDEVEPGSFYEGLVNNEQYFDFSKLPETHEIFQQYGHVPNLRAKSKDRPGIWKVESTSVHSLCAGKSKCYSLLYCSGLHDSRLKGVNEISKRQIEHETFVDCMLQEEMKVYVEVNQLRSRDHDL